MKKLYLSYVGFEFLGMAPNFRSYEQAPLGLFWGLFAGLCWALYIVFGKRLSHIHPGPSVAMGMSVAALVVLPFGVAHAGAALLSPSILLAGLAVAVASSAIPYSLDLYAMRHIPKRTFGVLLSAEPAVGAVAGLLLLHEHLSGQQALAIAAIVAASPTRVLAMAMRNSSKIHCARSISRQRTTPCIAGIGPLSIIRATAWRWASLSFEG